MLHLCPLKRGWTRALIWTKGLFSDCIVATKLVLLTVFSFTSSDSSAAASDTQPSYPQDKKKQKKTVLLIGVAAKN